MADLQALGGIRVLDLAGTIAGWNTGMLLGDFGAEVVHASPPGRVGATEIPGEAMWHRNKTCASIDWDREEDLAVLRGLLAGADVCITSDAEVDQTLDLTVARSDRLVHVSMPSRVPFGSGGIEVDNLLAAISGIPRRQGSFGGGPIDSVYPFLLYTQGVWGAVTAVAALFERERSGLGQRIEVDGLHGALLAAVGVVVIDPTYPPLDAAAGPGGRMSAHAPYRCSDGEWLFFLGIGSFQRTAFEVLGLGGVLDDPRVKGHLANLDTPENRPWVRQAIVEAFATNPRDHWLAAFAAAGCPCASIGERDSWLDHPQIKALGQRKTLTDPVHGEVVMGGVLVDLAGTPAHGPRPRHLVAPADLPRWPAHGSGSSAPAPQTGRGPLDGVRVIDLGLFFAGPFAGQLLAELGADVAKIERREGSNSRDGGFHFIRGRRSLAIDLQDPVGRAAAFELACRADVVIDNFRPGVLGRLGLDYDSLAKRRPDVVSVSVTSFGDVGPLGGDPGTDPILQAMSGMMAAQGGDSDPVFHPLGMNDIAGAAGAALGACLALFHRARTGGGQRVHTSLSAGSVFMQSGELIRYAGRPPARIGGRDYRGPSAADRFYATADGSIRLAAPDLQSLVRAGVLSDAAVSDAAAIAEIQVALAELSGDEAMQRLAAAGIAAVHARYIVELQGDESIIEGGYLSVQDSVDGKVLHLVGRLARFSRTERADVLRTPGVGEHSRELLAEAGLSVDAIDAAISSGVVVEGPPVIWFSSAAGQF